jgi:hypothetical protein
MRGLRLLGRPLRRLRRRPVLQHLQNSAGPLYGTCEPIDQPAADEFACKWLSCAVGQVCLDSEPAGDGCPMAGCAELPEACDDDPSCECLEQAFGGFGCTEDSDGNVTVRGFLLTP